MFRRIGTLSYNTYREAVRARVLLGLRALAFGTSLYSLAVGAFTLNNGARVVADLGAASISLYAVIVSVVIAGSSLYREVEQKTLFPILARPVRRTEYLVGKYLGTLLTLVTFVAFDAGVVLSLVALMTGKSPWLVASVPTAMVAALGLTAWKSPRHATFLPVPLAFALCAFGAWLAMGSPDELRVVLGSSALSMLEVAIVAAFATFFASFSSPFLSTVFTLGIFLVGRSADTLAKLPTHVFGPTMKQAGRALSHVVPNLQVYVPPRPLLTGEASGVTLTHHLALASVQSLAWTVGLLAIASVLFRRRDFL
jgi:Cu-processing system permease protein